MKNFYKELVAALTIIMLALTMTATSVAAQEKPAGEGEDIAAVALAILVTAGLANAGGNDYFIGDGGDSGPVNMDLCPDGRVGSDGSCVTPVGGNVDIDAGSGSGGLGLGSVGGTAANLVDWLAGNGTISAGHGTF